MIESFGIPENKITGWVGITTSVIPGGQCLLGIPWGLLADRVGRKPVLLSCLAFGMTFTLMTGFSKSLVTLIIARAGLGLFSGNVGIARAMAAELVPQKEKRAEAFNILYVSLSIAGILGPALGGALAEPGKKFPASIGKSALLKEFPYLLPSLIVATLYIAGITVGFLMMEVYISPLLIIIFYCGFDTILGDVENQTSSP
jgi:MFS family permease